MSSARRSRWGGSTVRPSGETGYEWPGLSLGERVMCSPSTSVAELAALIAPGGAVVVSIIGATTLSRSTFESERHDRERSFKRDIWPRRTAPV